MQRRWVEVREGVASAGALASPGAGNGLAPLPPSLQLSYSDLGGGGLPQLRPHLGLQPTFLPGGFKT